MGRPRKAPHSTLFLETRTNPSAQGTILGEVKIVGHGTWGALARAMDLGGTIVRDAMDIPGIGRTGIIADRATVALITTEVS